MANTTGKGSGRNTGFEEHNNSVSQIRKTFPGRRDFKDGFWRMGRSSTGRCKKSSFQQSNKDGKLGVYVIGVVLGQRCEKKSE